MDAEKLNSLWEKVKDGNASVELTNQFLNGFSEVLDIVDMSVHKGTATAEEIKQMGFYVRHRLGFGGTLPVEE